MAVRKVILGQIYTRGDGQYIKPFRIRESSGEMVSFVYPFSATSMKLDWSVYTPRAKNDWFRVSKITALLKCKILLQDIEVLEEKIWPKGKQPGGAIL